MRTQLALFFILISFSTQLYAELPDLPEFPADSIAAELLVTANRMATEAEYREIDELLKKGKESSEYYDQAIKKTIEYFQIDTERYYAQGHEEVYSVDIPASQYGVTDFDQLSVVLFPEAMKNPSILVSTIIHELTHVNQIALWKTTYPERTKSQFFEERAECELMANISEVRMLKLTKLYKFDSEMKALSNRINDYLQQLEAKDKLEKFFKGIYPILP